jgi:hypothetical protein
VLIAEHLSLGVTQSKIQNCLSSTPNPRSFTVVGGRADAAQITGVIDLTATMCSAARAVCADELPVRISAL